MFLRRDKTEILLWNVSLKIKHLVSCKSRLLYCSKEVTRANHSLRIGPELSEWACWESSWCNLQNLHNRFDFLFLVLHKQCEDKLCFVQFDFTLQHKCIKPQSVSRTNHTASIIFTGFRKSRNPLISKKLLRNFPPYSTNPMKLIYSAVFMNLSAIISIINSTKLEFNLRHSLWVIETCW